MKKKTTLVPRRMLYLQSFQHAILPKTYHSVFVTPLEDLFKNHFDKVTGIIDQSGGDIHLRLARLYTTAQR